MVNMLHLHWWSVCVQWERHVHRWIDRMASEHLTKENWRKSSQWFALTRAHAQIVVEDTIIDAIFRKDCYPTREDGWYVFSPCLPHMVTLPDKWGF